MPWIVVSTNHLTERLQAAVKYSIICTEEHCKVRSLDKITYTSEWLLALICAACYSLTKLLKKHGMLNLLLEALQLINMVLLPLLHLK